MSQPTPRDPAYWQALYETGDMGWDKGRPAPPLVRAVEAADCEAGLQVLVPGCGLGHEAVFLAQKGFRVTAVDFAPGAIASLKERCQALPLKALERDLFGLAAEFGGCFDLVVEHTCFCAIPLERRDEYAETIATVLGPEGKIIGLFYDTSREQGPPFRTNKADIYQHFGPYFNIVSLEQPVDSFENRRGEEWLVQMEKR